ncbi:glycosyltransferase [Deinococcus radiotolerans]|uniref:Glycosyl transferase n=1 Tax=Deinococcus radiotolerans TaxID=1309407 RepID=A0ABQ2FHJ4_9DEIO|nr:glycosyltransferase [Deinococcus radiotolerans]GGK99282.1 glycosyl transferase [Deinococcus radiotolerans]
MLAPALIVLAHLRWDFVFQRPQHLMTRAARTRAVYYVEEPLFGEWDDTMQVRRDPSGVIVCTPHVRLGDTPRGSQARTAALLHTLLTSHGVSDCDLWVYTPLELPVADLLRPRLTVYDCMDELANFQGASPLLREREDELFRRADVVFTGGHRLFEHKARRHPNVHAFPSSVDAAHFRQARAAPADPADQRHLPRPRLGYVGVIDERLDLNLIDELAERRPDWQLVLLGPVVKIDPASLPQAPNIHLLGMKAYADLPAYLAHWDVALLPFALNAATEFISPTKTPEYLAAGRAVVSTPIHDVVRPYGQAGTARIAGTTAAFEAACAAALAEQGTPAAADRLARADALLATQSWDATWAGMLAHLDGPPHRPPQATSRSIPALGGSDD